jgi:hypothetical protein
MPANEYAPSRALSDAQIEDFIRDGFVRIDNAFPRELADEGRAIMWRDLPCDPDDPTTWTQPVIRLPGYGQAPFQAAAVRQSSIRPSINSLAAAAGFRAPASELSRCVSLTRTTPVTPAGTWTPALQTTTPMRTSSATSRRGA